jgi:uncharacterized membrane protein
MTDTDETAVKQVELTVYGTMALLGVVAAALAKNVVETAGQLVFTIITATLALVISHAWAGVVAHRLVHQTRVTRVVAVRELWFAATVVTPAVAAIAVIVVTAPAEDFAFTATMVQLTLMAMLFAIGFFAAHRAGARLVKALAWASLDLAVGIFIVLLKDLLTYFFH